MGKRGSSGLSLVVGVDKPAGMTSHDVVNRVRRVFGERRCGHMGTLDPAATGALAVCIGPATRLDAYLTAHDKRYEFTIVFGSATDTDDAEGEVIRTAPVPVKVTEADFAQRMIESLVGEHNQIPPVYSAVKKDGKRAYEEARKGRVIDLAPRPVSVYEAELLGVEGTEDEPIWRVRAFVSAGTYVRSIARDMGVEVGSCAYVGELRRLATGELRVEDCVSLEQLEADPFGAVLDPVRLLGLRFVFLDDATQAKVACGNQLRARDVQLFRYSGYANREACMDACTSGVMRSDEPLAEGERVCMVAGTELAAIYEYDAARDMLKSRCGFAVGVRRG